MQTAQHIWDRTLDVSQGNSISDLDAVLRWRSPRASMQLPWLTLMARLAVECQRLGKRAVFPEIKTSSCQWWAIWPRRYSEGVTEQPPPAYRSPPDHQHDVKILLYAQFEYHEPKLMFDECKFVGS